MADTLARRAPLAERLALVAEDAAEAAAKLRAASEAVAAGRTATPHEFAERAATGPGPSPGTERIPPCTLPPSPLAPRRHWVVDGVLPWRT
ncbi:hypothetical protein ABZX30_12390 [Streptomyces sp. NPDC004542]|uniref:hypothetical protein n=1 Tax=Streptomyces sp. NPDC004542 TaxID=3154281 RepID=UPI00339FE9F6